MQTNANIVLLTAEFKRLHDHDMILNKYIKRSANNYERNVLHRRVFICILMMSCMDSIIALKRDKN